MTIPEDRWLITASPLQSAVPTWHNSLPFDAEFTEPPASWEIRSQAPAMETALAPLNLLAQLEGPPERSSNGVYEMPLDPFALSYSPGWDLVLIVDTGMSMHPWFSTANAIAACAHDLPLFHSVRVIRLANRQGKPPTFKPDASSLSKPAKARKRRCMVLLMTDGVGPIWQRHTIYTRLREWADHHVVAILQTLPHPAWELAALDTVPARLRAPNRGCTNRALVSHDSEEQPRTSEPARPTPQPTLIPVLELHKRWVEQWVRLLLSKSRVHQHVVTIPDGELKNVFIPQQAGPTDPPPEASARVARFQTSVPPATFALAVRLAMAPLNRFVMDLIADKSQPAATPRDLSRILTNNLLVAYDQPTGESSKHGQVTFGFADGVRQCLLAQSDSTQTYQTASLLEKYAAAVMPPLAGLTDRLRRPSESALPTITQKTLPYLQVESSLLTALSAESPDHRQTAESLQDRLNSHASSNASSDGQGTDRVRRTERTDRV